jgi:hypothetical protein
LFSVNIHRFVSWPCANHEQNTAFEDITLISAFFLVCTSRQQAPASSTDWASLKNPLDFKHGKELLKTLDFDVHNYAPDTLVDLALEVFYEVLMPPICITIAHPKRHCLTAACFTAGA